MEERLHRVRMVTSANDRFKARWGSHVAWSTFIAVLLHGALFAFWPAWEVEPTLLGSPQQVTYLMQPGWSLPLDAAPGAGDEPGVGILVIAEEDESETGRPSGGGDGEIEAEAVAEMLRNRLLVGGPTFPTVVDLEPAPEESAAEEDETGEDGEPGRTIDSEPVTTDFADLLELSPLDLERLSMVQPEIVLGAFSEWPLVRNPTEVIRFMTGAYESGRVDPTVTGTVSVTVWIDERGSVGYAEIAESSGRPDMDELALTLFNEVVTFRPARRGGIAVPISVTFWVNLPWLRGLLP